MMTSIKNKFYFFIGLTFLTCTIMMVFAKSDGKITSNNELPDYQDSGNLKESALTRLTYTDQIDELELQVSSDGKEIVFEGWASQDEMGLFSIHADNGQNRKLIFKDKNINRYPNLNANQKQVYFAGYRKNDKMNTSILLKINKHGLGSLYITPLQNNGIIHNISVSQNEEIALSQSIDENEPMIYIIDTKNNFQKQLKRGLYPSWSPDGESILFTSLNVQNINEIHLIEKDCSNHKQFTIFNGQCKSPSFSPDGKWICFAGFTNNPDDATKGNWDIYVTDINETKLTQITKDLSDDLHPIWSSDGSIYFTSRRFGNFEIMKFLMKKANEK